MGYLKLTDELQQKLTEIIRAGNYASIAAQVVGIGETTFYRWMQIGREAHAAYDPDATETVTMTGLEFGALDADTRALVQDASVVQNPTEKGQTPTVTFTMAVDPQRRYRQFWESIKGAEAHAEVEAVSYMREGMLKDWKAAATYLERRHPDRWRRRETVFNEEPPPANLVDSLLDDPRARELVAELEELIPDTGGD